MGSQKPFLNDADEKTANLRRRDGRFRSSAGKVYTSKGLRARRLRLSAPTAIQFYDVQDRLGCDRPTEAIDWLIQNAKSAIDALSEGPSRAEDQRQKQSFKFPSMPTSLPSSSSTQFQIYPLQNFSQKGNFSVLSPIILNATSPELFGQEPPPLSATASNAGTGFPSFPMWD